MLYVFVVIHHGSRRLVHFNVTEHPTSAWTLQQLREAVGYEACYRYLIHDRDSIFAKSLDESIARLGMTVLKSPFQSPTANAICERVIGTIRHECLDWMIPLSEAHLHLILKSWVSHYNQGRAHMSLGPGVPDPPAMPRLVQYQKSRHRLGEGVVVHAESIGRVASRVFIRGGGRLMQFLRRTASRSLHATSPVSTFLCLLLPIPR